jgi:hypothetical protein
MHNEIEIHLRRCCPAVSCDCNAGFCCWRKVHRQVHEGRLCDHAAILRRESQRRKDGNKLHCCRKPVRSKQGAQLARGDCRRQEMVMQFLVTSAARKCFRCFVGGMVGVPNTYRAFDQNFLGEHQEDNPYSHIHFVVQFVCCCNSSARCIRCTDRKVPGCKIMLAGQKHLRDPRQPCRLFRYVSDL